MVDHNRVIAVIPARGGSKRLPRKNVLSLGGKPLIEWTIDAAVASKVADCIVVTSDDEEVLGVASRYGSVEAMRRSPELATDTTPTIDVVLDVLQRKSSEGQNYETVILLQPTSPLRRAEDIIGAYGVFKECMERRVVSVCEVDHPLEWCGTITDDGFLEGFAGLHGIRSQDLPKGFRINGAVYISPAHKLFETRSFFDRHIRAYCMERTHSIDIDCEFDLRVCECLVGLASPGGAFLDQAQLD